MEKLFWNILICDDKGKTQRTSQVKLVLNHIANILDGLTIGEPNTETKTYQINVAYSAQWLEEILFSVTDQAHFQFTLLPGETVPDLLHQSDMIIYLGEMSTYAMQLLYTLPMVQIIGEDTNGKSYWIYDGYHIEYASHMLKACIEATLLHGAKPIEISNSQDLDHLYDELDGLAIEENLLEQKRLWYKEKFPLWISIVLAIGFYAEKLLGWSFGSPVIGSVSILGALAALGFLLHGLANGVQLKMNFSKKLKEKHLNYINHRYTAEVLRIYKHLKMAGLPFDLASIPCHPNLKRTIRMLIRSEGYIPLTPSNEQLNVLEELLDKQIQYHKDRINRIEQSRLKLQRYIKWFTQLGIVMVLIRSGLQVVFQYYPISGQRFGIANNDALKSFLNMLALMLPAIAGYFSNSMSIRHHQEQKNMSEHIQFYLVQARHKIHQSKQNLETDLNHRYYLNREIQTVLIKELDDWYRMLS